WVSGSASRGQAWGTTTCLTSAMYRLAAVAASSGLPPSWRLTMYAAYQSHQSCGGATASKDPWRRAVSWRSCASTSTFISDPSGDALGDFLQHPLVAVGVREDSLAEVGPAFRIATGLGWLSWY